MRLVCRPVVLILANQLSDTFRMLDDTLVEKVHSLINELQSNKQQRPQLFDLIIPHREAIWYLI